MESEEEEVAPLILQIATPATTVIVTTSLLSVILIFVTNTEWIRISFTQWWPRSNWNGATT